MDLTEFYNQQAAAWDDNQCVNRPEKDELLKSLCLRSGEDVLEIGCGTGWLIEAIACSIVPGRLYALDFSGEMLKQAVIRRYDFPIVFMHASAEDIPLPNNSVDRIVMVNTFSQFPKPELVIGEASRVLRKGGRLDIKYFFSREEINRHHTNINSLRGLGIPGEKKLSRWFNAAGFISFVCEAYGAFSLTARVPRQYTIKPAALN